jgi:hypothetical protein
MHYSAMPFSQTAHNHPQKFMWEDGWRGGGAYIWEIGDHDVYVCTNNMSKNNLMIIIECAHE